MACAATGAIALILLTSIPALATEYEVGSGKAYTAVEQVPWELLEAGDVVSIHARREPYRAKWVLCRRGTADRPIVVRGIPGPDGTLPVIDGRDAVTRSELNYWGEQRGVIKIGGANRPADTTPAHIVVENLEIRSGRPPYQFTGRSGDSRYAKNAASIFIEEGEHITLRGCTLHDSGNGLFSSPSTRDIVVESCWIHGNGAEGSIYEHNNYTSTDGLTFRFNHFGPLREGCPGNNLKDRSAGLIVAYNWIEGGNRALDLVDGRFDDKTKYGETFVYGNVLVERDDQGNSQVVHYGGDSNQTDRYRKGVLYFYNNTVVSYRGGNTTLFRLSTQDERVECRNNIFHVTAPGHRLALLGETGSADLHNNWFTAGWRTSHSGAEEIRVHGRTLADEAPGFISVGAADYRLADGSPCRGAGGPLPAAALPRHRLQWQYVPHRGRAARPDHSPLDLGAFAAPAP